METVSINELLPTGERIRKIHTGSEILLAYELNKYAKMILGKELDLTDISIAKEIQGSLHFSFAVTHGLNIGSEFARESLADLTRDINLFFTNDVLGIDFESVSDKEIVYNHEVNIEANRVLYRDNRSAGYISLVAYLMVKARSEGKEVPRLVIDHKDYSQQETEYVDLFILKNYGNKILKDMVDVQYSTTWGYQPDWIAFVMYNRQRGAMNREFSIRDKQRHLNKSFAPGDVVLLYQRSKIAKGKRFSILKSCYPAVIQGFDSERIRLVHYPIIQTRMTRHVELDEVEREFEDFGKKSIYTDDDYEAFLSPAESYDYTEIGVDTCTWLERVFFIKPVDFDGAYQYFRTPEGMDKVFLSTLDAIYAVFEDRGVAYNKEKFLKMYFNNRVPVYEKYKQLQP